MSRRIIKQMEKEENGCKGRYKRPGNTGVDASDGKGNLSQRLWDCVPRVCGRAGGGGGGKLGKSAKTGLYLPGGQTWEALRAL